MNDKMFLCVFVSFLQFCSSPQKQNDYSGVELPIINSSENEFLITSKSIGWARLGETKSDFIKTFNKYQIDTVEVWNYCVDGGGDGLFVSYGNEDLLFVWTLLDSDSIYSIIALSNRFHTKNGIRPNMSVGQLKKIYPKMKVTNDMLCEGDEIFVDSESGLIFEFISKDSTRVGFYNDDYDTSEPIDTARTVTRITIRNNH